MPAKCAMEIICQQFEEPVHLNAKGNTCIADTDVGGERCMMKVPALQREDGPVNESYPVQQITLHVPAVSVTSSLHVTSAGALI